MFPAEKSITTPAIRLHALFRTYFKFSTPHL